MAAPNRPFEVLTAQSALRSLWAAAVIVGLPAIAKPESAAYYLSLSGLLLAAAVAIQLTRHRLPPRQLSRLVLATGSTAGLFAAFVTGGADSPAYQSYAIVVVGGAWLVLDPLGAVVAAAITIAVGPALIWADHAGVLPAPWVVHSTWSRWATAAAACALLAVVQRLEFRRLRTAVDTAQVQLARAEQAQIDVARERSRYADVVSTVPGVVCEFEVRLDGSRAFTFMSGGAQRMFGVAPEEALHDANAIFRLVAPEWRPLLEASIAHSCATLEPWEIEGQVITTQGEAKWLRGQALPTRMPDGTLRWHGVLTDNTSSRRNAQSLREAEASLKTSLSLVHATLESTADGLIAVNRQGQVTGYNQKFLTLWQIPSAVAEARDDRQLLEHVKDQLIDGPAFLEKVRQIYGHPDSVSFDTLFFKDGRCFERYSQPQVVDDVSVGRVWSFRDVSERVAEEERRRKLEQQLHQSQTMEALGTLSAGIAHDFNNLLTVIIGRSELAQARTPDASEHDGHLRDVLEAARQASDLVRQIREFSQPHLATRAVVRVAEVVGPALDLLRSSFPPAIDVRILLDPHVAIVADRSQLQQVVTNLAVNARQAIGDRAGRIEIALDVVGPDRLPVGFEFPVSDAYAHLSVCDTGSGIPADALAHVFEPFFTTKDVGRGRGLGLAVVHGIVQRHGGAVTVESDPGNGACFRVLLPVYSGQTTSEPSGDGAPTEPATPRLRRVLVVDDDERVAKVMAGLVAFLAHEATIRTDPVDALALFRGDPGYFDLVLTDLSMPQLSGLELGRQIFAIRPDAAVVLLTGFSADLTLDQVRAMGFRELVHKPITLASLADLLHRAWRAEGDAEPSCS